jgi:hypothetical protein
MGQMSVGQTLRPSSRSRCTLNLLGGEHVGVGMDGIAARAGVWVGSGIGVAAGIGETVGVGVGVAVE